MVSLVPVVKIVDKIIKVGVSELVDKFTRVDVIVIIDIHIMNGVYRQFFQKLFIISSSHEGASEFRIFKLI